MSSAPEFVRITEEIVFMHDMDGAKTITNDAENVVEFCHIHWTDHRYVYRGTDGEWTELLHKGPVFLGFKPYDHERITL